MYSQQLGGVRVQWNSLPGVHTANPSLLDALRLQISSSIPTYEFSVEKRLLQDIELQRKKEREQQALLKEKEEPQQTSAPTSPSRRRNKSRQRSLSQPENNSPSVSVASESNKPNIPAIDFLEFEQGLAPPDPWSTPATLHDDLKELRLALHPDAPADPVPGSSAQVQVSPRKLSAKAQQQQSQQQTQQQVHQQQTNQHQNWPSPQLVASSQSLPPKTSNVVTSAALSQTPTGYGHLYVNQHQRSSSQPPPAPAVPPRPIRGAVTPPLPPNRPLPVLSPEATKIRTRLLDMGFSADGIHHGLNFYPNDEKKVLDYAMIFDKYPKVSPLTLSYMLNVFDEVAVNSSMNQHLASVLQLLEFGFDEQKIHAALKEAKGNVQLALDRLTGS